MTLLLGAIADDYTGASDLANTFTKNGLRTVQTIGIPDPDLPLPDVDAVVVSLKIRSVAAQEAVSAASKAEAWLRARGAIHVLYKICSTFDSTDAGNIGPVTDALRKAAGGPVIVTPAFPETGRTVYAGHLFVNGVPLNESPLKDHPLNPMHDANLVRVLARQSAGTVGLIDLTTVAGGPDAVSARLAALRETGVTTVIADAVFESDLETLGAIALEAPLSTGASGLGLGLARALVRSGRITQSAQSVEDTIGPVGGLAAIVAGSCSTATLRQLAQAERSMPVLRLDPEKLLSGPDELASAVSWAGDRISAGPVAIAASADPQAVGRVQARYGREASGHAIEHATSAIAAELVFRGVRRLVVAGGETSGAAVDRLGIPAFLIGPEIAPGVPVLRTVGNTQGNMLLALKSGNFGGDDFFAAALSMMH
ncbi:four-carbon acid sugar kinase family protein (plasmid) [Rhizobium lusitanum]|uniref:3-oxo-tetronate kinase n=1 Tax=Rhizobium lusitanum TaxID=293958 RepID=UPI001622F741|nr:3-oxo-tetronate kinase [Rhizobium lusitanum]QND45275.1 four-carbon acid sugar kinase family protein [Rhizobium lusitanum]